MKSIDKIKSVSSGVALVAVIEKLLTLGALVLVAATLGNKLGPVLGLPGELGMIVGWSIAIVYDALWIGSLRMSELAIRQRSVIGMVVTLGLSVVAIGVSTAALFVLGHAQVFAFVPAAAAAFMGLRLFAGNVLADPTTAAQIAKRSAADRNARALAAADARHLQSEARTEVLTETAGHLAELHRQTARAEVLTMAQAQIDKARAKAEKTLAEADKKHGAAARAFMTRDLALTVSRPAVTQQSVTGVTQVRPQIEGVTPQPVTEDEPDIEVEVRQAPSQHAMTLEELAAAARVETPQRGVTLTDEQLDVVLRWLRYSMEPPRSYRQAQEAFRGEGFQGGEHRVRRIWGEIETREAEAVPA
ncbi:hypothetical protein [Streptomyces racemochromogenes]|uniref:hypothetical protein n=1 Tax=Streptomyces racemochromogenes TaxID=67353 RepID=UPI0031F184F1